MSFRNRLALSFLAIVIVPMVVAAVVLFRLIETNETGKADARLAARLETSINLYDEARDEANRAAIGIARDQPLADALRAGDRSALRRRATQLLGSADVLRIVIARGRTTLVDVGSGTAVMPASRSLTDGGRTVGRLQVSVREPEAFAGFVERVTGVAAVVQRSDGSMLANTLGGGVDAARLPAGRGRVEVDGVKYDAASFAVAGFLGERDRVALLSPTQAVADSVGRGRLIAGLALVGFLGLASIIAATLWRSLQRQLESFLHAARRLGAGDFSAEVPITGHDEFAALGEEFNKMSRTLKARLDDLDREQHRRQIAMRRIGDAFVSSLDRDGLLGVLLEATIDGVDADAGRAAVRTSAGGFEPAAVYGAIADLRDVVRAAEEKALETGEPAAVSINDVAAASHPMRDRGQRTAPLSGVVTLARRGRDFNPAERELFGQLVDQAAVSVENVGLHDIVGRQAVTDELTSLSNRRRFQEALTAEVERTRRFGQSVGLVLLDLDDFKVINDSYGHQQGDLVLREVARVLHETSREVDVPARYGGEELAVVLPGTDLDGAHNFAERVRIGIEELALPLLDGDGLLTVTASFGVATLPGSADDQRGLVQAADDALYRAKRAGKNRTVRAEATDRV